MIGYGIYDQNGEICENEYCEFMIYGSHDEAQEMLDFYKSNYGGYANCVIRKVRY